MGLYAFTNFLCKGDKNIFKELPINEQIRAESVRLVAETGEQLGIMSLEEALSEADKRGLDLALLNPGNPAVCKLMDYGKCLERIKRLPNLKKFSFQ